MEKQEEFTKSNLETGMLVQYRRGDIGLIIGDKIIERNDFMKLSSYDDDLLVKKSENYNDSHRRLDIMRVSEKLEVPKPKNWIEKILLDKLIWERDEIKKQDSELIEIDGEKYRKRDIKKLIGDIKRIAKTYR